MNRANVEEILELRIDHEPRAEIGVEQPAIDFPDGLYRQRFACLDPLVGEFFEFGKHRLSHDRGSNVINLAIDQVGTFAFVVGCFQQVADYQFLVERACHLGDEDGVLRVLVRLMLGR